MTLRDLDYFQDRENAIALFDRVWADENVWILAFNGVAGQGKSTLLDWLEVNRCRARGARYSAVPIGDFFSNLSGFLSRLLEASSMKMGNERLETFQSARDKVLEDLNQRILHIRQYQNVENSPEAQQSMSANVAEAVRALQGQAEAVVIEHWLACLRSANIQERTVFLLDNYDIYQDNVSLDEIRRLWSTLERARQVLPLLVIVASREPVRHTEHIEALRRGLEGSTLPDLSQADSSALLAALGIQDSAFHAAVFRLAQGHPLLTRMAADAWHEAPGGILAAEVPKVTSREQAVSWLQNFIINRLEPQLRLAARWMMVLRWFSFEVLNAVLAEPIHEEQYRRLTQYAFVVPSKLVEGRKAGHDLVRRVQIEELRREQETRFAAFQRRAMTFFAEHDLPLEALYHQFLVEPEAAFKTWQDWEAQAGFRFDHHPWALLSELGLRDELNLPTAMRAEILFRAGRRHYYRAEWFLAVEHFEQALGLFREIGDRLGEASARKAIGDVQQFRDERDAALESYQKALGLFREIGDRLGEASVYASLGKLQIVSGQAQEGLQTLQNALNIYGEIGQISGQANILFFVGTRYAENGHLDEGVKFVSAAVELGEKIDPNHPVTVYMRETLRNMKQSQQ